MVEGEEKPEEKKTAATGQRNIIIAILVAAAFIFVGLVLASSAGYEPATRVVQPIYNVVRPAQRPTPTPTISPQAVVISGTVELTGRVPSGSTISIGIRKKNEATFKPAIKDLRTVDGVEWSWKQAESGQTYEVQAFLISEGSIISQSQIQTAKAPAEKISLVINYSELPAPPVNSFRIDCLEKDSKTDLWKVNFTYNINNPTSSARQYWLGIGTSRDGELALNAITKPRSPDVAQTYQTDYIIKEGTTHFAAYAYAECADCNEFSRVSEWFEFSCKAPTPTPAP